MTAKQRVVVINGSSNHEQLLKRFCFIQYTMKAQNGYHKTQNKTTKTKKKTIQPTTTREKQQQLETTPFNVMMTT